MSKGSRQQSIQYFEHISHPDAPLVILFHGFGADAHDLESLRDFLDPDEKMNWIFPNGIFEVPIGPGFTGRAWWPLTLSSLPGDWSSYSPPDIEILIQKVMALIASLNVPWNKIILGGFSQGAMLATEIYLSAPEKPAGLISMSGSLIRSNEWKAKLPARKGATVFLSHGERDQVLPSGGTQKLLQLFKQNELACEFVSFQGGHEIPMPVLTRAGQYLKNLNLNL